MINPHPLGDTRNSASVPYTAQLKGETLWKTGTTQKTNPQPARQLAIKDDFLVVSYGPSVGLHQRASGQAVWSWQIGSNFKFQMTPDGLATVDHAGFFRILHFDKTFSDPLSLPFLDDQTVLFFITRSADEIRYCFALMPLPTNSPDDMAVGPQFYYLRYSPKNRDIRWEFSKESEMLDLLHDIPGNRLCVIANNGLYVFPADAQNETSVLSVQFEAVLGASLDAGGRIIIAAREMGQPNFSVMALESDLKPSWRFDLGPNPILLQPPCPMPDKSITLLMGKELVNIAAGKRTWAVTIPGYTDRAFLTVLKDGDFLVAAGPLLTQFTPQGQKRHSAILEETITCRPIVDEDNRIYVAGTKGVYCLK